MASSVFLTHGRGPLQMEDPMRLSALAGRWPPRKPLCDNVAATTQAADNWTTAPSSSPPSAAISCKLPHLSTSSSSGHRLCAPNTPERPARSQALSPESSNAHSRSHLDFACRSFSYRARKIVVRPKAFGRPSLQAARGPPFPEKTCLCLFFRKFVWRGTAWCDFHVVSRLVST